MDEQMNGTPAPRRRRRAAAQEQAFEEFVQAEKTAENAASESQNPEVTALPAFEPVSEKKESPVPQFEIPQKEAEPMWGGDDEDEEPVRKPKNTGKGKKKKKKKGGCLIALLVILLILALLVVGGLVLF
ncbi:MAG: hypothetical protein IJB85_01685, partial [Clostridia bacterium]|nr:hypothetical protein [Clostridia bacterium]